MNKTRRLLLFVFALTVMSAWADDNNRHFSSNPDGTATVIPYEHETIVWVNGMETIGSTKRGSYRGDAVIPSVTPDGKTVTGIGKECFADCTALTSVKIPNTIKSIGINAFEDCDRLKELIIPSSVETMGSNAIWSCDSIERLIIMDNPNTLQIPSGYEMFRSLRGPSHFHERFRYSLNKYIL